MKLLKNFSNLLRVKDWSKNILIFLPLIFSGNLNSQFFYFDLFSIFILFCLSSSFIYIINDLIDIKDDKKHPIKILKKPLASGHVSLITSYFTLLVLFIFISILILNYQSIFLHITIYIFLNFIYSIFLKKIPILDVLLISFGYIIRLDSGSEIILVDTSIFLASSIYFLACFIIFIKRYTEYKNNHNIRSSLVFYSEIKFKFLISISSILFFLTLCLFIYFKNLELIIITPFLIYVLIRYYKSSIKYLLGEFPFDLIIKDRYLLLYCLLIVSYILYIYY